MIPRRFFWLSDLAVIAIAFALTYAVWPEVYRWIGISPRLMSIALRLHASFAGMAALPSIRHMSWILALGAPATVFFLSVFNAHAPLLEQSLTRIIVATFGAPLFSSALLAFVQFTLQRGDISRLFIYAFTVVSFFGLCTLRLALRSYMVQRRDAGQYAKHVLLVGRPDAILMLLAHFHDSVSLKEYRIEGYLAKETEAETRRKLDDQQVECLGGISELGDILIRRPVHEVVAVQSDNATEWLRKVIEDCDALGVLLRIVPQDLLFGKTRTLRTLYPFQILHLPAVVLAPPHFDSDALFFKRVLDIVVSGTLLALLSPLFLIVAIMIKLTDRKSEVFYRWNVVGRNGARFTGYKFTTMYSDADERRKELLDKNEMTGPVFKIRNDPRVTPLGRFLRKYSLNELPQLWSVLRGDMSLVGPRPAFPHELEGYGFWHKRKLSIRPGMTCLWQVRGRNKISNFDEWVKMDLEYIDNWSLWLDFKILVRTAWAVVAGTGS